jgi:diguanylate cyclase (GGDEF)-like protein/PAS domain S-box-containing protein
MDQLAATVPVGLLQFDAERHVVYTNDRLHQILAVEPAETVEAQLANVTGEDRAVLELALTETLSEGRETDIEVRLSVPPRDMLRFCAVSLRALSLKDGTVTGAIACVADVTDSARMREELKKRAAFDELTGCYNRGSIMLTLEASIETGGHGGERAVIFIDIDHFKAVNDQHGHAAGDEALRVIAQLLRDVVRDQDMVGRVGGDEFLVVCPDIGGPEQAMKLAERLAGAALEQEIQLETGLIVPQLSLGVAWSCGDNVGAEALVTKADRAMYESKHERAGRPKLAAEVPSPSLGPEVHS